jgi:hypothetical protein
MCSGTEKCKLSVTQAANSCGGGVASQCGAFPECHARDTKPCSIQYIQILVKLFLSCWQGGPCLQYQCRNPANIIPFWFLESCDTFFTTSWISITPCTHKAFQVECQPNEMLYGLAEIQLYAPRRIIVVFVRAMMY